MTDEPRLDRVRFCCVGENQPEKLPWRLKSHPHGCHEFIVVISGRQRLLCGSTEVTGSHADILFCPAGTAHEEWSETSEPLRTYFLQFHWPGYPPGMPFVRHDGHGRIRQLVEWLAYERMNLDRPLVRRLAGDLTSAAVMEYVRLWRHAEAGMVTRTRRYVNAHKAETVTLSLLAEKAEMSPCHFLRRYKKLTGRTPMEDVRLIRIEAARDLLLTTSLRLHDIAARVGFTDACHMARVFKRYLGMTPGSLRKA